MSVMVSKGNDVDSLIKAKCEKFFTVRVFPKENFLQIKKIIQISSNCALDSFTTRRQRQQQKTHPAERLAAAVIIFIFRFISFFFAQVERFPNFFPKQSRNHRLTQILHSFALSSIERERWMSTKHTYTCRKKWQHKIILVHSSFNLFSVAKKK